MNINRVALSLAFGLSGLAVAHGEANVSFDDGVNIGSIRETLGRMPAAASPEPVATAAPDKSAPTYAGVKLMVDVVDDGYQTSWQSRKRWPFGPYVPVSLPPRDVAPVGVAATTLRFKSYAGGTLTNRFGKKFKGGLFTGESLVHVFHFASDAARAFPPCAKGEQQIAFINGFIAQGGSVSPSSVCLPKDFQRQEIVVSVRTPFTDGTVLPISFKLTVTPR